MQFEVDSYRIPDEYKKAANETRIDKRNYDVGLLLLKKHEILDRIDEIRKANEE